MKIVSAKLEQVLQLEMLRLIARHCQNNLHGSCASGSTAAVRASMTAGPLL